MLCVGRLRVTAGDNECCKCEWIFTWGTGELQTKNTHQTYSFNCTMVKQVSIDVDIKKGIVLIDWIWVWSMVPIIRTPPKGTDNIHSLRKIISNTASISAKVSPDLLRKMTFTVNSACLHVYFLIRFCIANSALRYGCVHALLLNFR